MNIKEKLQLDGYAFLARYEDTAEAAAARLGEAITPWENRTVQQLVPRTTSTPNTYSGIYGLNSFPFHTDLAHWKEPPRYFLLHCVKGFADVPTLLLDGRDAVNYVTKDVLRRAIVRPRRSPVGGMRPLTLWQAMSNEEGLLRWDEIYLTPASHVGADAYIKMHDYIKKSDPYKISLVSLGDTLVIDNWRMLHSRPPILPGRESRWLERVYLRRLI